VIKSTTENDLINDKKMIESTTENNTKHL